MLKADEPYSRHKSRINSDSVRTGNHHHADLPRASSSKATPKSVHSRVPSNISGELTNHPLPAYKALMDGLNQCYSDDLKADLGHRFDDVDDDVIIAYAKAHVSLFGRPYPGLLATLTVGEEANRGRHPSCLIPVPYLGIRYKYLDVILPLSRDYVRDLDNDVLRLLHVHLAAFDCGAPDNVPMRASHADLAESRHQVLCELYRRGFTERLPNIVRLKGLSASARIAGVEKRLGLRSTLRPRPSAFATQSHKTTQTNAADQARMSMNNPHAESRPYVRQHPQPSRTCGFNAASLMNKGQAPNKPVNKAAHTPSQSIVTPSMSVQAVHAESVSELDLSHSTKRTPQEGMRTKSEAEEFYDKEGPGSYITFGNPERIRARGAFTRSKSEAADLYDKEGPGSYVTFGDKPTRTSAADDAETDDPTRSRMYGVASEPRTPSDGQNDRARKHVRQGLNVPQKRHSGEPSPAKKRKSPVEDIQDVEMSDQSEGAITPSTSAQTVHNESALDPSNFMSARQACASRALQKESTVDESDLPYTSRDSVPESYMTMTDDLFRFMLRK